MKGKKTRSILPYIFLNLGQTEIGVPWPMVATNDASGSRVFLVFGFRLDKNWSSWPFGKIKVATDAAILVETFFKPTTK